jgi:hypothetical protein
MVEEMYTARRLPDDTRAARISEWEANRLLRMTQNELAAEFALLGKRRRPSRAAPRQNPRATAATATAAIWNRPLQAWAAATAMAATIKVEKERLRHHCHSISSLGEPREWCWRRRLKRDHCKSLLRKRLHAEESLRSRKRRKEMRKKTTRWTAWVGRRRR